jgi:hypothetical protein
MLTSRIHTPVAPRHEIDSGDLGTVPDAPQDQRPLLLVFSAAKHQPLAYDHSWFGHVGDDTPPPATSRGDVVSSLSPLASTRELALNKS